MRLTDTTLFLASLWAARGWFDPRPLAPEDVSDTRAIRALNFEEIQIETSVRSGAETFRQSSDVPELCRKVSELLLVSFRQTSDDATQGA